MSVAVLWRIAADRRGNILYKPAVKPAVTGTHGNALHARHPTASRQILKVSTPARTARTR
jgi:hypothetical protein